MKDLLIVVAVIATFCVLVNDLGHPDQHENYVNKYAELPTHIVKTGDPLTGIGVEDVILAPRKADDPIPVFRLSNGKEEIWKRCDWGQYEPPKPRQYKTEKSDDGTKPSPPPSTEPPKKFNFGDLRLQKGFGDIVIHVLDLVVEPDNTVTLTYCVDE